MREHIKAYRYCDEHALLKLLSHANGEIYCLACVEHGHIERLARVDEGTEDDLCWL